MIRLTPDMPKEVFATLCRDPQESTRESRSVAAACIRALIPAMLQRHSLRRASLYESFLKPRLVGATRYDRIAG
jgi:hypothetical protein